MYMYMYVEVVNAFREGETLANAKGGGTSRQLDFHVQKKNHTLNNSVQVCQRQRLVCENKNKKIPAPRTHRTWNNFIRNAFLATRPLRYVTVTSSRGKYRGGGVTKGNLNYSPTHT